MARLGRFEVLRIASQPMKMETEVYPRHGDAGLTYIIGPVVRQQSFTEILTYAGRPGYIKLLLDDVGPGCFRGVKIALLSRLTKSSTTPTRVMSISSALRLPTPRTPWPAVSAR